MRSTLLVKAQAANPLNVEAQVPAAVALLLPAAGCCPGTTRGSPGEAALRGESGLARTGARATVRGLGQDARREEVRPGMGADTGSTR